MKPTKREKQQIAGTDFFESLGDKLEDTFEGFGHKVETKGNQAFVSAPNHNTNRGIIYIFNRTTGGSENWGEVQKVVMENAYINTYFGWDFCFGSSWGIIGSKRSSTLEGQAHFIKYYSSINSFMLNLLSFLLFVCYIFL